MLGLVWCMVVSISALCTLTFCDNQIKVNVKSVKNYLLLAFP